jgi:serine/threonine-protein kinase
VAFTLLTGRRPFEGASIVEVCSHHLHTPPPSCSEVRGEPVDPEVEALVLACMAKKPEDRPASAGEIAERLGRCRSAASWTQARARAWWAEHDDLTIPQRNTKRSVDHTIDFAKRA